MNTIFQFVAEWLNDFENHRTSTLYEDSLILKVFAFQFVNSFSPLYFTAFVRPYIGHGGCDGDRDGDDGGDVSPGDACIHLLANSLLILYLSQILLTNVV